MINPAISAPIPCYGHPSSTFTILFVFITDLIMQGLSSGLKVLRLITSQSISCSFFKISAAYKEWPTIFA
jgi:hypothetical protein